MSGFLDSRTGAAVARPKKARRIVAVSYFILELDVDCRTGLRKEGMNAAVRSEDKETNGSQNSKSKQKNVDVEADEVADGESEPSLRAEKSGFYISRCSPFWGPQSS
jgi:hypothetical protein